MTKIFKIPFATQGDRASIPVETQADGAVSYTQGYGYDYERDQATDPAAKDIEREKMNSLFHDVTEAVGEVQLLGAAKWNTAGKPYPIRCVVYHKDKAWQSKVVNNNIEPVAGAAWAELKADATAGDVGAYSKTEADTKYQPKGNYQAAGDFATKAELNGELAKKFDKKGGDIDGAVTVKASSITIAGANDYSGINFKRLTDGHVRIEGNPANNTYVLNIVNRDAGGKNISTISIPNKTGVVALTSDLNTKLDKTGGTTSGGITSPSLAVNSSSEVARLNLYSATAAALHAFFQYNDGPEWYGKLEVPRVERGKTERLMKVGDFGWGGSVENNWNTTEAIITPKLKLQGTPTQVWRNTLTTKYAQGYSANAYIKCGDCWFNLSVGYGNGVLTITSGNGSTEKVSTVYSTTNTAKDRNGYLKALGSAELSDYPPGAPIPWPQATAPAGFLVCNGQLFNKTTYPLLTKAYPSGILPDLRGEFIRGLDAGRNIDENRDVLTVQGDAIRNITGEVQGVGLSGMGVFNKTELVYRSATPNGSGKDMYKSIFDVSTILPTANENRPRNIAFLYIVRAA